MRLVALLLVLLLSACAGTPVRTPMRQDVFRDSFEVRVNVVPASDINRVCSLNVGRSPEGFVVSACNLWDAEKKVLRVWIPEPQYVEDREAWCLIGHELGHGIWGDFHPYVDSGCRDVKPAGYSFATKGAN